MAGWNDQPPIVRCNVCLLDGCDFERAPAEAPTVLYLPGKTWIPAGGPTLMFLDDKRSPAQVVPTQSYSRIVQAWKAEEAVAIVMSMPRFNEWSLDHDLASGVQGKRLRRQVKTGWHFLAWALEHAPGKVPDQVSVHSANPWGRRRMMELLDGRATF